MLEKPALPDEKILACLEEAFGLCVNSLEFLPLGVDVNAAVYRAETPDGQALFVKLRSGDFDPTSVQLPKYLHDQGIEQIIAPLATPAGGLWASLEDRQIILYPYIEGDDGYEIELTDRQWRDFGAALRKIHTIALPEPLAASIPRENFSPRWREDVRSIMGSLDKEVFDDADALKLAEILRAHRQVVMELVRRAEHLAQLLLARPPDFVLCHSDLHAGNLLIEPGGKFYIVDWDNPILAPKERDLMYPGGAQGFLGRTPHEEELLFYSGYGTVHVDPVAQAYYRYERIVQDIAAFCAQIFQTDEGGKDREMALEYLASNFRPGNTIEVAFYSDWTWREG